jgi:centriolar protein POC1
MTSPDPTLERSLKGHKNTVTSVAFHPGGKYIASGSKDHDVICYYMKPGMRALRFAGHQVML